VEYRSRLAGGEDMPQKPLDAHEKRYNVGNEDLGTTVPLKSSLITW